MTVLVTGGTGFAGRHLADLLRAGGDEVVATARPGAADAGGAEVVELADAGAVRDLLGRCRPAEIYHLAADSSPRRSFDAPAETIANNLASTAAVLYAAAASSPRPRVLVVSSSEIYGPGAGARPIDEAYPPAPASPYAVSKLLCSRLAAEVQRTTGLPVVEARPFNHLGPGQSPGFVGPDFARQVAAVALGQAPPIIHTGDLAAAKDFSDVRDIVRGYRDLLRRGEPGGVYHLASGRATAVGDLLSTLCALAGVQATIVARDDARRPASAGPVGAVDRAATLGWSPEIPLARTLRELLDEWLAALRAPA